LNETVQRKLPEFLISAAIAAGVSSIGIGILSWRDLALADQRLRDVERRITYIETVMPGIVAENGVNSLERVHTKHVLDKLVAQMETVRDDVSALKQKPAARPDPFTGSEGRELEKRIRDLEGKR